MTTITTETTVIIRVLKKYLPMLAPNQALSKFSHISLSGIKPRPPQISKSVFREAERTHKSGYIQKKEKIRKNTVIVKYLSWFFSAIKFKYLLIFFEFSSSKILEVL